MLLKPITGHPWEHGGPSVSKRGTTLIDDILEALKTQPSTLGQLVETLTKSRERLNTASVPPTLSWLKAVGLVERKHAVWSLTK